MQTYVERPPPAALRDVVATTWVQRVTEGELVQHDVPSGSVELRCRLGTAPEVVGPLTRARTRTLGPGTTVIGVRLLPAAAARVLSLPVSELTDLAVPAKTVWRGAPRAEEITIALLLHRIGATLDGPADPLVDAAVRRLRLTGGDVRAVARDLHVSERHLRRRVTAQVGLGPKTLQRTLRFQRFLAAAQHAMAAGRVPAQDGLARLAADVGYADQAHLSRECLRLTGRTPVAFLGDAQRHCACGHDHAAAYGPWLGRFVQDPAAIAA